MGGLGSDRLPRLYPDLERYVEMGLLDRSSTPARNRTWIPTFGGWCRDPLDHQGKSAEGEGLEPSNPCGRRLSRPVRYQFRTPFRFSTISGPAGNRTRTAGMPSQRHSVRPQAHRTVTDQWSRGELNPVTVCAKHRSSPLATPVSSQLTVNSSQPIQSLNRQVPNAICLTVSC